MRPAFSANWGIARKDPAAMTPGLQRIGTQPAPERDAADLRHDPPAEDFAPQFRNRETCQRDVQSTRQFTGEPLNVDDDAGGKSGLPARLEAPPQGQALGLQRTGDATC